MASLTIRHLTRYRYRRPVGFGEHRLMLRPLESCDQRIVEAELVIAPEPVALRYTHDPLGNCVALARFAGRAEELSIESRVRLDHAPIRLPTGADDRFGVAGSDLPFAYAAENLCDLGPAVARAHPDPDRRLEDWARGFLRRDGPAEVLAALSAMSRAVRRDFAYAQRLYGPAQTPLETLARGAGTCRDFAVLMMEAARALGLAAQFVSGYVRTSAFGAGPHRRAGGHTHAWVRVYLPSCGWVEFDPTNGAVGGEDLIRVAVARDPRQAAPLVGSYDGAPEDFLGMDVEVDVDAHLERGAERRPSRTLMAA